MDKFEKGVMDLYRPLRKAAYGLTRDHAAADDLVQDTMLRAFAHKHSYTPDTNLRAWLYTILRNSFFTQKRKRRREVEDPDGVLAGKLSVAANQFDHVVYQEAQELAATLSPAFQQVLLLRYQGRSYEEIAETVGVALGTVKSRIARARQTLTDLVEGEPPVPKRFRSEPTRKIYLGFVKAPTISKRLPSLSTTPLSFVPAESFRLIGPDLRQRTVQVFRLPGA